MSHQDEPPVDPLPLLMAELDQALKMAPEVARMARGYFDAFKGAGFSDAHALWLTGVQLKDNPGEAPS